MNLVAYQWVVENNITDCPYESQNKSTWIYQTRGILDYGNKTNYMNLIKTL